MTDQPKPSDSAPVEADDSVQVWRVPCAHAEDQHGPVLSISETDPKKFYRMVSFRDYEQSRAEVARLRIEVAASARMIQTYPTLAAFFGKHALAMTVPSCFVCGRVVEQIGIKHMELPGIIACLECRDASRLLTELKAANEMQSQRIDWTVADNAAKAIELADTRAELAAKDEQIALLRAVYDSVVDTHGPCDYEAECPTCVAVKALRSNPQERKG